MSPHLIAHASIASGLLASVPSNAESSFWPIVSLLFFFTLFVAIVVWLLVTGRSGRWKRDARIPLDDERPVDDRSRGGRNS